jgi:hypothetical protein
MTDGVYSGWLLKRMAVTTDGFYNGWCLERVSFITDCSYDGYFSIIVNNGRCPTVVTAFICYGPVL